jgi:hypothetical protein
MNEEQRLVQKRLANDLATIVGVLRSYQAELAACVVECLLPFSSE